MYNFILFKIDINFEDITNQNQINERIKNDLICGIFFGILNTPVLCDLCEHCFCLIAFKSLANAQIDVKILLLNPV